MTSQKIQMMEQIIHLPLDDYKILKRECEDQGIEFMSTPFDLKSLSKSPLKEYLKVLNLQNNKLIGGFPEELCSIPIINIDNNLLCPPYPACALNLIGLQDTINCN